MYIGHESEKFEYIDIIPSVDQSYVIKRIEEDLYNKLYRWDNNGHELEFAGKLYIIINARPINEEDSVVYDILFVETLDYVTTGRLRRDSSTYEFIERIKNKAILSF